MKIQIIAEYYYPDNFRINEIAAELARSGHTVEVLTGLPDYTTSRIPREYKWFRRRREYVYGVKIIRVPTIARRHGVLFRMLSYGSFVLSSSVYALFFKKPDADVLFVYGTSPIFQGIPGIIWKKRLKKRLVLYCCDLWPESMRAWNVSEENPIFQIVKKLSGWIYRSCDQVAITSIPFQEYLQKVCEADIHKITYLPQHAEDLYANIAGQYEENGIIDFLFAGNIGAVQNVDCILKAASQIHTAKSFCIHIVGDGSELANCRAMAKELNVEDKIVFHGRHSQEAMGKYYKSADCLLLTLRGGDFIGMTLPGKAQTYLSVGKPIVAAIDGAGYEMVKEAHCGEAVSAGDSKGLATLMEEVIDNFAEYQDKGLQGRVFFEQNYTKKIFMKSLLSIFEGE